MGQKSLEVTAMGMEKPADKNANAQIKAYFCLKALFAICSWLEVKKKKKDFHFKTKTSLSVNPPQETKSEDSANYFKLRSHRI